MLHDHADPGYPGDDEREVGQRAYRHDRPDIRTTESLAQDEGVLRPDRHYQGQAGEQAVKRSIHHGTDARRRSL